METEQLGLAIEISAHLKCLAERIVSLKEKITSIIGAILDYWGSLRC